MTATTAAVRVDGLTKIFGTGAAIQDLSFEVGANRFVTVVGPSGCGKSTTLRMISGLMRPTKGKVYLRGKEVGGVIGDVGMVFQAPVLLPWRNPSRTSCSRRRCAARAPSSTASGLGVDRAGQPGGLRAAISPRAVRWDAATGGHLPGPATESLPAAYGRAVRGAGHHDQGEDGVRALQKIWNASKTTVLFVTHSITEAVLLSDTIIVMTARPGRAKAVIPGRLPRPRDTKILRDPRFVEIAGIVRDNIEAQWVE